MVIIGININKIIITKIGIIAIMITNIEDFNKEMIQYSCIDQQINATTISIIDFLGLKFWKHYL